MVRISLHKVDVLARVVADSSDVAVVAAAAAVNADHYLVLSAVAAQDLLCYSSKHIHNPDPLVQFSQSHLLVAAAASEAQTTADLMVVLTTAVYASIVAVPSDSPAHIAGFGLCVLENAASAAADAEDVTEMTVMGPDHATGMTGIVKFLQKQT